MRKGRRLQELILKMKQNKGKRFTLGYISSTCVRSFRIKTSWQSSSFITAQSPVRVGSCAQSVAFLWAPTSWNRSPRTSDASKPVNAANWIFSLFAASRCKPERWLRHGENPSRSAAISKHTMFKVTCIPLLPHCDAHWTSCRHVCVSVCTELLPCNWLIGCLC